MSHHTEPLGAADHDISVRTYFAAAGNLVAGCLARLRAADPAGYGALSDAVSAGACFRLVTEFSAAGPLDVRLLLVDSGGAEIEIGGVDGVAPTFN